MPWWRRGGQRRMSPRSAFPANTGSCWCAAGPMATTPRPTGWKKSKPTAANSTRCRKIIAIGSQRETMLTQKRDAAWLQANFEEQCARFQAWAEQELAHRAARDAALL